MTRGELSPDRGHRSMPASGSRSTAAAEDNLNSGRTPHAGTLFLKATFAMRTGFGVDDWHLLGGEEEIDCHSRREG
jgi:hypothetical protein